MANSLDGTSFEEMSRRYLSANPWLSCGECGAISAYVFSPEKGLCLNCYNRPGEIRTGWKTAAEFIELMKKP